VNYFLAYGFSIAATELFESVGGESYSREYEAGLRPLAEAFGVVAIANENYYFADGSIYAAEGDLAFEKSETRITFKRALEIADLSEKNGYPVESNALAVAFGFSRGNLADAYSAEANALFEEAGRTGVADSYAISVSVARRYRPLATFGEAGGEGFTVPYYVFADGSIARDDGPGTVESDEIVDILASLDAPFADVAIEANVVAVAIALRFDVKLAAEIAADPTVAYPESFPANARTAYANAVLAENEAAVAPGYRASNDGLAFAIAERELRAAKNRRIFFGRRLLKAAKVV
jgi:hypothetical protein